jgi:hypothetical protein
MSDRDELYTPLPTPAQSAQNLANSTVIQHLQKREKTSRTIIVILAAGIVLLAIGVAILIIYMTSKKSSSSSNSSSSLTLLGSSSAPASLLVNKPSVQTQPHVVQRRLAETEPQYEDEPEDEDYYDDEEDDEYETGRNEGFPTFLPLGDDEGGFAAF